MDSEDVKGVFFGFCITVVILNVIVFPWRCTVENNQRRTYIECLETKTTDECKLLLDNYNED